MGYGIEMSRMHERLLVVTGPNLHSDERDVGAHSGPVAVAELQRKLTVSPRGSYICVVIEIEYRPFRVGPPSSLPCGSATSSRVVRSRT